MVYDEATLRERVDEVITMFKAPCLVEEYIEGREFNVALLGYPQARVLPLQEIDFSNLPSDQPRIVSYDAKWRTGSVEDLGTQPVMHPDLLPAHAARLRKAATEACRAVGVRDYGRVDVRLSNSGIPYVIDVNPNCDLSPDAGYARGGSIGRHRLPCPACDSWFGMRSVAGRGSAVLVNLAPRHRARLVDLLADTPEFTAAEVEVALELVDSTLAHPGSDDYRFVVSEEGEALRGYACSAPHR